MGEDKPSVLLVDDDRDILWTFGRHLLRCGFQVAACMDGGEAISMLESRDFDLMMTDLKMPRVDGLTLIDWARERKQQMRVILITGFGSQAIRNLSHQKSVTYLEKPVDLEDLVDTIIEILSTSEGKGFAGTIVDIDWLEYLQLMVMCGRQAVLEVSSAEGDNFRLFVNAGRIEHALGRGVDGEEAFFKCVECPPAAFSTLPWTAPSRVSLGKPSRALLAEAAARRDPKKSRVEATGTG